MAPLLDIRPLGPPVPDLSTFDAIAFTSRNGVEAFAELCHERRLPVFTVGESTAGAARDAGFTSVRSADGALADLVHLLARAVPAGGGVLVPGARETAGDIAAMLRGTVGIRTLAVYEVIEPDRRPPPDFDAVLIHSTRAARALCLAVGPDGGRGRLAIAISAAAASALSPAGFATVAIATRPTGECVLEALGKAPPAI